MTRRYTSTLLLLLLSVFPATLRAQSASAANSSIPAATAMPREERLKVFDQVWRAVAENYYDKHYNGVDWAAARQEFRPQVEAAASSAELYHVLRQMLGRLGDAHTRIYAPTEGFDRYRPSGTTVGLVARRVEGRPTVAWVEPGSEAARQGVRAGFVVNAIDGAPVEQVLQRIRAEIGESSTPVALDLQSFDRLFAGVRDTTVTVEFADDEARARTVMLARRFVEFQRRVSTRQLPYKIGYIELTGFGPEIERDFELAMQDLQGMQGIVLDLRNNGGGFVATVAQVASYFLPEETSLGEFITRQGHTTARQTQRVKTVYRGPLTVLVSARSASGSEIFAAAMQERHRAAVIGASPATCGCLLGVSRTLKLPDGGKLNISDTDYRTALGRRIEGIGLKPDQQVEPRAVDLLDGRDRALEAAVEQLSRSIAFGQRGAAVDFKLSVPGIRSRAAGQAGSGVVNDRR